MKDALASALLEEYFKSWNHFISDELVYFCDIPDGDFEGRPWIVNWPSKYKLRQAYIDLHTVLGRDGGDVEFRAFIDVALPNPDPGRGESVDLDGGRINRKRGVLVDIAEGVKFPKGMFAELISSLVRLKRLDDLDGFTGDVPRNTSESFFTPPGLVTMNREIGISRWSIPPTQQGKLPRKLAETRSKIVGQLTDQKRDFRRGINFKPYDVHSLFKIILFRDGYRVDLQEKPDFLLKRLEVFFCPRDFNPCVIHPVYSTQTVSEDSRATAVSSS